MIMEDGFPTIYTFLDTGFTLWEYKSITPPGIDGGGSHDTSTMSNVGWRSMALKKLKTLSEGGGTAAYDPAVLPEIVAAVNVNQEIEILFPNGAKWSFWGGLTSAKPGDITEGSQPTIDFTITPTNRNDLGALVAPAYEAPVP